MQASKGYLSGSVTLSTHVKGNARKHPVWVLRYRLPSGKQSDKTLGPVWCDADAWQCKQEVKLLRSRPANGYLTQSQAETAKQKFLDDHAEAVPEDRKTFGRACDDFLQVCERERNLDGTTLHEYRRIAQVLRARSWRDQTWAERPLDSFEESDLIGVRTELLNAGKSPNTINQTRRVVRGAFGDRRVALAWKWVAVKRRASKGKLRFFTPDEVDRVRQHAADDLDRAVITLGAEAGMRMNEIRGLKIAQCDFEARLVRLEDGYTDRGGHAGTKGNKVRSIPMSENVYDRLRELCSGREPYLDQMPVLVFELAPGVPIDYHSFRRRFIQAIKAARLHQITPHELRHTFGTQMIQVWDIYKLQRVMGHEKITTTEIYLHFKPRPEDGDDITSVFGTNRPAEVIAIDSIRKAS